MLVERHGAARSEFGIVEVNDSELRSLGISACRFQTPEGRQRVSAWWQRQKERIKAAGA